MDIGRTLGTSRRLNCSCILCSHTLWTVDDVEPELLPNFKRGQTATVRIAGILDVDPDSVAITVQPAVTSAVVCDDYPSVDFDFRC